ncbi:MAG: polyribonucleotide nucleotidyltransferase [Deltaproteobacteria bacterium]|nr:polyribonucleotide nucleotidyltransferase [Deltaproteobacteria bacterium]
MEFQSVSVDVGGRPLVIETGRFARQATGAVVIRQGDSVVLVTAVIGGIRDTDFVPLTVDYQDRTGAYGRIPGSYFKREGRQNERETLVSRVIDRPLRPLFPKTFRNETQVIATAMSYDPDNDTAVLALCGASAALSVAGAPLSQAVAGVRVARVKGELVVNPSGPQEDEADLLLTVAGTADAVIMVEGGGREIPEVVMLDALDTAHAVIQRIIAAIVELKDKAGKPAIQVTPPAVPSEAFVARVEEVGLTSLREAMAVPGKHARSEALRAARQAVAGALGSDPEAAPTESDLEHAWEALTRRELRTRILDQGIRVDGRATDEIRPITCEVGVAPRAHGSAVFTRGETQVFATIALGTEMDAQRTDFADDPDGRRSWMLTYYFPPYCTGEAYMMRGPRRREIGHGALAHRAIEPVLPSREVFPYVMRSTAEVMESNGSSSMATVCATILALMDAGVPISTPVAGIAMGLVKEGERWAVLSDILGDEDHLGDMDFKVTGTARGITAFQMDVKIAGVSRDVMSRALAQAREGRIHILGEMARVLDAPRAELSKHAPRITTIQIKPDRIKDIIGPGGRVIRSIQEKTGTRITVEDSGKVDVAATDGEASAKAIAMIRELTQEAEIGKLYVGVVKRVTDFGAFVEIFPGTDGLIHISHLAKERVDKVTDVVNEGDEVLVRVIDIDRAGKIRLSRKEAIDG